MKTLLKDEYSAFISALEEGEAVRGVRINTVAVEKEHFLSLKRKYSLSPISYSEDGFILSAGDGIGNTPEHHAGMIYVQDPGAMASMCALNLKEGAWVLDTCSAPGGKSFAMAILSSDEAEIHSYDLHESKLSLITDTATRLGLNSVHATVRDALTPDESLLGRVDKLLCDVPCSGLGVIAKKPDLRYKDISATVDLPPLQLDILTASSRYLKAGGELVYSTCTLNSRENAEVVMKFIEQNPDFTTVDFEIGSLKSDNGMLTLWPHIHNTDGFFISKLRKNK